MSHRAYIPLILGAFFTLVACIASMVSVIADDWVCYDSDERSLGLWYGRDDGRRVALPHKVSIDQLFQSSRAFACMGCVFIMLAGLVCLLFLCVSSKRPLALVATVTIFIGMLCYLIAVAIFAAYMIRPYTGLQATLMAYSDDHEDEITFGMGWALALIAFWFSLAAGIALAMAAAWAGGRDDSTSVAQHEGGRTAGRSQPWH